MDRRKLFGGVMAISLLAAALFGAVYAWEAIRSQASTSTVGQNNLTLNYVPTGLQLGPNDNWVTVATGSITNSGTFALKIDAGTVNINPVVNQLPVLGTCVGGDFDWDVDVTDTSSVAPGATGGGYAVHILTKDTAPPDCQQDQVSYVVNILVSNP